MFYWSESHDYVQLWQSLGNAVLGQVAIYWAKTIEGGENGYGIVSYSGTGNIEKYYISSAQMLPFKNFTLEAQRNNRSHFPVCL